MKQEKIPVIKSDCTVADPGSFRDPSGVIFRCGEEIFRQVNLCYRLQYDTLISSGLYEKLSRQKMLISHREVDREGIDEQAYLVLKPELIPLISYPYEWCFGQLKCSSYNTAYSPSCSGSWNDSQRCFFV